MFNVEDRDRARARLLELADADERMVAAAVVGAEARGEVDRWSDLDLTFAIADSATIEEVVGDWSERLASELDAIELFDLWVGPTVYRVFLLPGCLQVDLSFTPAPEFGPRGPHFKLLFGAVGEGAGGRGGEPKLPTSERGLVGMAAHHAVRARFAIERERLWLAEYWIGASRDHFLEAACRRTRIGSLLRPRLRPTAARAPRQPRADAGRRARPGSADQGSRRPRRGDPGRRLRRASIRAPDATP